MLSIPLSQFLEPIEDALPSGQIHVNFPLLEMTFGSDNVALFEPYVTSLLQGATEEDLTVVLVRRFLDLPSPRAFANNPNKFVPYKQIACFLLTSKGVYLLDGAETRHSFSVDHATGAAIVPDADLLFVDASDLLANLDAC